MAAGSELLVGNAETPGNIIYLRNTDDKILLLINY